jgi:type I restriction enzyme M protein
VSTEPKARNYNLDITNPHNPGGEDHDPDQLLADYARLQDKIASTRATLKSILDQAPNAT